MDIRTRAVDDGLSRRAAAKRFGVPVGPPGCFTQGDGELRAEAPGRVTRAPGALRRGAARSYLPCRGSSGATESRGKKTGRAVEQDRPDVLRKRRDRFEAPPDLDPSKLVLIDETWTATNMARTHGRCRSGAMPDRVQTIDCYPCPSFGGGRKGDSKTRFRPLKRRLYDQDPPHCQRSRIACQGGNDRPPTSKASMPWLTMIRQMPKCFRPTAVTTVITFAKQSPDAQAHRSLRERPIVKSQFGSMR